MKKFLIYLSFFFGNFIMSAIKRQQLYFKSAGSKGSALQWEEQFLKNISNTCTQFEVWRLKMNEW